MTDQQAILILNALGVSSRGIHKAREFEISPSTLLSLSSSHLVSLDFLSAEMIQKIKDFKQDEFLKSELKLVNDHGVETVFYDDELYPLVLKEIVDAPVVLYRKGNLKAIDSAVIAIVGSRLASLYGLTTARSFAQRLTQAGFVIASGLARGIDTAAHEGALSAQGLTIAVLGCGLKSIYPPENKKLFENICKQGVVFSEFSMQTPPLSYNFPKRNRIISGLSLGVVVIEAFTRSGALITSRLALEQGREVFALPGNINNPQAQGTNNLIKQGAKLIMGIEDVLEELKVPLKNFCGTDTTSAKISAVMSDEKPTIVLSEHEQQICSFLKESQHIDRILEGIPLPVSQIRSLLFQLELKKIIQQLPGQHYKTQ